MKKLQKMGGIGADGDRLRAYLGRRDHCYRHDP